MKLTKLGLITCALALSASSIAAPLASADPAQMESLIKEMDAVSHEATAKNEEVKQLSIDIDKSNEEAARLAEEYRQASAAAQEAAENAESIRSDVNQVAKARYRGASLDPLSGISSAHNPQDAIDRTAYMSALSQRNERIIVELQEALREAAQEHERAAAAKAVADFRLGDLKAQRAKLEREQDELNKRTSELEARIDALEPSLRQAWQNKNGPIEGFDLAGITSSNPGGMSAVNAAMSKLGAPYGWGATGPDAFDCSGLMVWSYAQQGKSIPRTSQAQMAGGTPVSRDQLQPGDIVGYYPGATHVGMYIGDGKLVHASDYGIPVQVVSVDSMPFYGARRY
ncbi:MULTISPECIES: NlpC/P60 family protein [unclassified Corynebacterium]|uniref:C40 family peptidase n=1 Tax=unclassified Corynebacterium TaxID=2624378 RepID=UPI001C4436BD|nr:MULTISPECIES: C40 family peptidase [unclassified Corynebacterium]MBV7281677.1 C40 family peptidase [Corynebacterium sp. TAE3-ERU30]MBV7301317.1 C40 family peptidase [Corynebacterium sp. TAE3-ERU2]